MDRSELSKTKYDKSVVIPPEYEDVCIPSDKVTMPLLFIDNKAWYGLPIYQHVHTEASVVYPIHTDVIVRFSGKCTAAPSPRQYKPKVGRKR